MKRDQTARKELGLALRELADRAHASLSYTRPARLHGIGRALLYARDGRVIDWRALERSLRRVHAREQAGLLREAAELLLNASLEGRLFTAPGEWPVLEDWLRRCATEIERALAGRELVAGDLLACTLTDPGAWPPASELAAAALALEESARGRLLLARAHYAEGRRAAAERCYRELVHGARRPLILARAGEALGIACERRGARREALRWLEQAAGWGAGLRAEVASLGLALALDERVIAQWAAERIEAHAGAGPFALRFAREVRARWELANGALPIARGCFDALLRGATGPVADACLELFPATTRDGVS